MAQQQSQAQQRASHTSPMESLQGTMNFLLTILGQTLNQPARLRDPQHRLKTQGIFPTANIRFHEALDRMEQEINMAQTILRRDLALHRVTEKLEAEKALAPPVRETVKPEPAPETNGVVAKKDADDDIVMADIKPAEIAEVKVEPPQTNGTAPPPAPTAQMLPAQPQSQPQPTPTSSANTTAAPPPAVSVPPVVPTSTEQASPILGSAAGEMDFSSIFGDDATGADEAAAAALDDTLVDFGDDSADVSSLLPGLASYANLPGTDENAGMPDATANAPSGAAQEMAGNSVEDIPGFDFGIDTTASGTGVQQQESTNNIGGDQTMAGATDTVDFGDIDFSVNFDDATGGAGGGDGGAGGDNTFNDLFDLDDYDFSGDANANAKTGQEGQDMEDWMNSFG